MVDSSHPALGQLQARDAKAMEAAASVSQASPVPKAPSKRQKVPKKAVQEDKEEDE